jgi:Cu/Ag efflux pump CusA
MTALATGLALVPLVVAGNVPGHEIEYPMAIVILGGMVTSTLLNLFVVPSLYLRFGASPKPAEVSESAAWMGQEAVPV